MYKLAVHHSWFKCDIYGKFREAAKLGFQALEILNVLDADLNRLRDVIGQTGVELPAIITRSADSQKQALMQKMIGIVNSDSHSLFLELMLETIETAKWLGTKNIVVTTGNEISGMSRAKQKENIIKALKAAAPLVEGADIRIIVEPLNTIVNHKGYFLNTTPESVDIIREVGSPNVLILYDIYHQQITEGNIINNITNNIRYIGHFHVADVPGRKQPGTGELNYRNIFNAIRVTGFDGYVAFECGITEDVETVCKKMWALQEPVT